MGLLALWRFLRSEQVALLCTHGYKADILGVLAGRICGIPVVCFLRGFTAEDWKVRLYEALDRAFLRWATRIVCLTQAQAQRIALNNAFRGRVQVVTNAIAVPKISPEDRKWAREALRQRLGLPADRVVVACAGRLSPEKGTAHFVEAAARVNKDRLSATFVVFGDGPLRRQLEEQACSLGLGQEIIFAGFLPDLLRYFVGIDVLVNPSLSEEMPNVVLEAMAAGIPVVATDVGGVAEIAGDGETLVLAKPGDAAAIAEAVARLLKDPERAARMGLAARRRVEEAY